MKNILLLITSSALLLTLLVIFLPYLEQSSSRLKNFDEVLESGLIERGWIPKYIPRSATDIYEKHDLDTNKVVMSFTYNPKEKNKILMFCKLLVENKKGTKYFCPPFEGQTSILTLRNDGLGYYNSENDGLY